MSSSQGNGRANKKPQPGITSLRVCGFKSIREEVSIDVRPLTILAGANSSGKSSSMQALLLLKQTLEASYDPGPLLLDGPNVKFTQVQQLLSSRIGEKCVDSFHIDCVDSTGTEVGLTFTKEKHLGIMISEMSWLTEKGRQTLRPGMQQAELAEIVPLALRNYLASTTRIPLEKIVWKLERRNCFLGVEPSTGAKSAILPFFFRPSGFLVDNIGIGSRLF